MKKTIKFLIFSALFSILFSTLFSMAAARPSAPDHITIPIPTIKIANAVLAGTIGLAMGALFDKTTKFEIVDSHRYYMNESEGEKIEKYVQDNKLWEESLHEGRLMNMYGQLASQDKAGNYLPASSDKIRPGEFFYNLSYHAVNTSHPYWHTDWKRICLRSALDRIPRAMSFAGMSAYCTYKLLNCLTDKGFTSKRVTNKIPENATTY